MYPHKNKCPLDSRRQSQFVLLVISIGIKSVEEHPGFFDDVVNLRLLLVHPIRQTGKDVCAK